MTNAGPTTVVGNVGVSPGTAVTGFPPGQASGTITTGSSAATPHADVGTAYTNAAGRPAGCAITVSGNLGGSTLTPGLYRSTSTLAISSGDLTLDAQGDGNAVFIFQVASALTVTSGRAILLAGNARAANVFWQIGSSATFGTTSSFVGTVIADQAITFETGATLSGRALANNAAVTLDTNSIVNPSGPGFDYSGTLTAKMTSDQSVPPTDAGGSGTLAVVSTHGNDGGYAVSVSGVLAGFGTDNASVVHIHAKHAGLNGPILEGNSYSVVNAAGSATVSGSQTFSQAAMQEIAQGRAYVNVHTAMYPNGAVRGQILRIGDLLWSAQLSGENEVPPTAALRVGGVGFIVSPDGGTYYEGSWASSVVAVAAHLHDGGVGENGPVIVPLTLIGTTGTRGMFATADVESTSPQYVNVHAVDAGSGLIRGQLIKH